MLAGISHECCGRLVENQPPATNGVQHSIDRCFFFFSKSVSQKSRFQLRAMILGNPTGTPNLEKYVGRCSIETIVEVHKIDSL